MGEYSLYTAWWLVPIIAALIAAFLFYDYKKSPKKRKIEKEYARNEWITAICFSAFALLFAVGIAYYKYLEYEEYKKFNELFRPYDGGHGIGIDTQTVNEIKRYEDSIKANAPAEEMPKTTSTGSSYSSSSRSSKKHHYDNMRGFDPASEDDMDDNGMDRFMENNDEGGWY